MLGTIHIVDLHIRCIVGILPREREQEQSLFLDVELDHDFALARTHEDVRHTVDYAAVSQALTELVQARRYQLIETLAEDACDLIFARWPAVTRCKLLVKKPDAVEAARYTGVSVERRAGESAA